jgi:hypothetical protein
MIGLGAGLITLGFVGIALSDRMEIQRRQDWILVCQRAGASVSSFATNLSAEYYYLGVSVWVHNYAEGFYSVLDANRTQVIILHLANTDQSSEWKYSETSFQITDSGYYTFELYNATSSSFHSTAKLYQRKYVDEYVYPYRSFLWAGVFSLIAGVSIAVVGFASQLTPNSKTEEQRKLL